MQGDRKTNLTNHRHELSKTQEYRKAFGVQEPRRQPRPGLRSVTKRGVRQNDEANALRKVVNLLPTESFGIKEMSGGVIL